MKMDKSPGLPVQPRRQRTLRVIAAFLAVWVWTSITHIATSDSWLRSNPVWWLFLGVVILVYLLCFAIPVYVVMDRLKKHSVRAYLVGALMAVLPLALFMSALGKPTYGASSMVVAVTCGLVGYWIVER